VIVRPVADDEWPIVAWLYQDFRHDLAPVVNGFPYADGRYRHDWLDEYPGPGRIGYIAWTPHPNASDELGPIAFALVKGLEGERREMAAFFVVPAARADGIGKALALDVVGRHRGPWEVGFQHDNRGAGHFWRAVANDAWGDGWVETEEPVPGKPDVPPDHWIRST
jgi:GNAT superfamily N-acetyltransferase